MMDNLWRQKSIILASLLGIGACSMNITINVKAYYIGIPVHGDNIQNTQFIPPKKHGHHPQLIYSQGYLCVRLADHPSHTFLM